MPQQTHWAGYSNTQLPSIEGLNQPAVAWPSSGPPYLQPEPNYYLSSTGVSLQSPFNTTHEQAARLKDAGNGGNDIPASRPQDAAVLQGLWLSAPNMTQEHGGSSHEIERRRADDMPSKRPSRKRKAPPLGEAQWEQKKPYIEQLYIVENLPLSEVLQRMERNHEFFAT